MEVVDRYGPAIEYDLHERFHLDLLDFFRHRYTWRKLDELIWRLPAGSAFWAARTDDDDAARETLRLMGANKPKRVAPPLAEMSRTNQSLLDVVDLLQLVVNRVEALGGGQPRLPTPALRPTTAMARASATVEARAVDDLIAEAYAAQARGLEGAT